MRFWAFVQELGLGIFKKSQSHQNARNEHHHANHHRHGGPFAPKEHGIDHGKDGFKDN